MLELSGEQDIIIPLLESFLAFQRKRPAAIGTKANYPGFIEPALASPIERVPNGERWVHKIKFDGYRVQLHLTNESIRVEAVDSIDLRHFQSTVKT